MTTLVELCAGAAACALHALGGRSLTPPVAWMGGKRRLAPDILAALGVRRGTVDRIVLVDASTWGWVWPVLLGPDGELVGDVLRAWGSDRGARKLWDDLVQQPPLQHPVARAAQWLWLQARSASGVPVWWGPDLEAQPGGAWMAPNGKGQPTRVGQKGGGQRGGGMTRPATIADRIDAIRWAIRHRRVRVDVVHGDAQDFTPIPGSRVVFDPPYKGRTGYGWRLPRPAVVDVARRHRAAGARVAVCEAEPVRSLSGWACLELAPGRASDEWLTLSHKPPARRGQLGLFAGEAAQGAA